MSARIAEPKAAAIVMSRSTPVILDVMVPTAINALLRMTALV